MKFRWVFSAVLMLVTSVAAAESPGYRLYYGLRDLRPRVADHNIGTYLAGRGLPAISSIPSFGLQFDTPSFNQAYLGWRFQYNDRLAQDESAPNGGNFARLKSFAAGPALGFDFIESNFFRLGIIAGVGLVWAELDHGLGGQEAFDDSGVGWTGFVGASCSFGIKAVHIFFEGGWNRTSVDGWRHKWNQNEGVHHLDLSGTYLQAGIAVPIGSSSK